MREILYSALLASILHSGSATSQSLLLTADDFDLLGRTNKQSTVNSYNANIDELEPIDHYPSGAIHQIAIATGMLRTLLSNNKGNSCTAVLVDKDIILTNYHCAQTNGEERITKAVFFLGYRSGVSVTNIPKLTVHTEPLEYDNKLDYALLRLAEPVTNISPVKIAARDPSALEDLFVIGHPSGGPQQISRRTCQAYKSPIDGYMINHTCHTQPGSSGSLVFSDIDRNIIVALHFAGAEPGGTVNKGIRMTSILAKSAILSELAGIVRTDAPAIPTISQGPIALIRACDQVAAFPGNPDNPSRIKGVEWKDLNATDAIAVCKASLAGVPDHSRLQYQLGRAYQKAGKFDQAAKLFMEGVETGYAASMSNLASITSRGEGNVEKDQLAAIALYERAVTNGHAVAARFLGDIYRDGEDVEQDYTKAMSWYRKANELGDVESAAKIGYLYDKGYGIEPDDIKAVKWYTISANADIGWAIRNLGRLQIWGSEELRDYDAGRKNIERAYDLGDVKYSASSLGRLYEEGLGVNVDYAKAMGYFKEAIAAGNTYAHIDLGDIFRDRKDGKEDYETARFHYQAGWGAGVMEGAAKIAYLYDNRFLTLDTKEATDKEKTRLYRIAAEAGVGWAMNNLGNNYRHGDGVAEDVQQAIKWYQKAIETSNHSWANLHMGELYIAGNGVPINGKKAREHFEETIKAGNDKAVRETAVRELVFLLGYTPSAKSIFSATYSHTINGQSIAMENPPEETINPAIASAQALGLLPSPLNDNSRKGRINALRKIAEPEEYLTYTAVGKARGRALELLQANLAHWGRDGLPNSSYIGWHGLLQSLFSAKYTGRYSNEYSGTRNLLIGLTGKQYAKWNPDQRIDFQVKVNAQYYLNSAGFHAGKPDGVVGPTTRSALRQFQKAVSLPTTGKLSLATYYALWQANMGEMQF